MVIDPPDDEDSPESTESGEFENEARRAWSRHRARKERVLHTRISDDLAADIRRVADDLRVPVSNVVRNVLEEAFSFVEYVSDNFGELIDEVVDEAEAARDRIRSRRRAGRSARPRPRRQEAPQTQPSNDFDDVLGWQPLVLNRQRRCDQCDALLARGAQAFAGVTQAGIGGTTLCSACVEALG